MAECQGSESAALLAMDCADGNMPILRPSEEEPRASVELCPPRLALLVDRCNHSGLFPVTMQRLRSPRTHLSLALSPLPIHPNPCQVERGRGERSVRRVCDLGGQAEFAVKGGS